MLLGATAPCFYSRRVPFAKCLLLWDGRPLKMDDVALLPSTLPGMLQLPGLLETVIKGKKSFTLAV